MLALGSAGQAVQTGLASIPKKSEDYFPKLTFLPRATAAVTASLWRLALNTAVIPYAALSASLAGCTELSRSGQRLFIHTEHQLSNEQLRRAWFGLVGGAVCGVAAVVAAAISAWLGAIEFAARAGKSTFGALAAQLAEGAHFGSEAARGAPPSGGSWDLSRGWRLACAEGGLFYPGKESASAPAHAEPAGTNAPARHRRRLLRRRNRRNSSEGSSAEDESNQAGAGAEAEAEAEAEAAAAAEREAAARSEEEDGAHAYKDDVESDSSTYEGDEGDQEDEDWDDEEYEEYED